MSRDDDIGQHTITTDKLGPQESNGDNCFVLCNNKTSSYMNTIKSYNNIQKIMMIPVPNHTDQ